MLSNLTSTREIKEFLVKYLGREDFFTGRMLRPHEVTIKPVFKHSTLENEAIFNYVITSKFQSDIEITDEVVARLNYQTKVLLKLTEENYLPEEQKFILQLKLNDELNILDSLYEELASERKIISFDSYCYNATTQIH